MLPRFHISTGFPTFTLCNTILVPLTRSGPERMRCHSRGEARSRRSWRTTGRKTKCFFLERWMLISESNSLASSTGISISPTKQQPLWYQRWSCFRPTRCLRMTQTGYYTITRIPLDTLWRWTRRKTSKISRYFLRISGWLGVQQSSALLLALLTLTRGTIVIDWRYDEGAPGWWCRTL